MNPSSWIKTATAAYLLAFSLQAHASIISGSHTTSGGKVVNLSGLEWLTWDETYGVTRTSIEADFGGFLSDGWRYATGAEFGALISSLWGGTDSWNEGNYDGSQWMWENFDNPDFTSKQGGGNLSSRTGDLFVGAEGECSADTSFSCRGHWRAATFDVSAGSGPDGWFHTFYGATGTFATVHSDAFGGGRSSVLVRAVNAVPEPATAALLGVSLIGFAAVRRRVRRHS